MPRRSKQSYRSKQKRTASKLEQRTKKKVRSTKTAERSAPATVDKPTGGEKNRRGK